MTTIIIINNKIFSYQYSNWDIKKANTKFQPYSKFTAKKAVRSRVLIIYLAHKMAL